ncbi:MAG: ribonuclease III domain-containing protein [Limnochordia bacterium]|nr:ribonuclease III domain-containing protein [Limnochordia bacterium]
MFVQGDLNLQELSPLTLAYVGDAVFELYIRTKLVAYPAKVHDLHRSAVKYVQAAKQAEIIHAWEPELTDEEREVVRRGRNAKGGVPRKSGAVEYRLSTGMEALLGYLYLSGQEDRLRELLSRVIPTVEA